MNRTSIARRIGRGLMVLALAVSVGSLTSPGTAYAKHGNGAAIALGILGGALAGAAIASSTPPGYYAPPPAYYCPPAPPVYSVVPCAGLFLRAAGSVLCPGAVLRAGILLQPRLKAG
jgi:hypothetical protein